MFAHTVTLAQEHGVGLPEYNFEDELSKIILHKTPLPDQLLAQRDSLGDISGFDKLDYSAIHKDPRATEFIDSYRRISQTPQRNTQEQPQNNNVIINNGKITQYNPQGSTPPPRTATFLGQQPAPISSPVVQQNRQPEQNPEQDFHRKLTPLYEEIDYLKKVLQTASNRPVIRTENVLADLEAHQPHLDKQPPPYGSLEQFKGASIEVQRTARVQQEVTPPVLPAQRPEMKVSSPTAINPEQQKLAGYLHQENVKVVQYHKMLENLGHDLKLLRTLHKVDPVNLLPPKAPAPPTQVLDPFSKRNEGLLMDFQTLHDYYPQVNSSPVVHPLFAQPQPKISEQPSYLDRFDIRSRLAELEALREAYPVERKAPPVLQVPKPMEIPLVIRGYEYPPSRRNYHVEVEQTTVPVQSPQTQPAPEISKKAEHMDPFEEWILGNISNAASPRRTLDLITSF